MHYFVPLHMGWSNLYPLSGSAVSVLKCSLGRRSHLPIIRRLCNGYPRLAQRDVNRLDPETAKDR